MTAISEHIQLSELKTIAELSACSDSELKVVRDSLVMTQDGVDLAEVPSSLIAMIRKHAAAIESGDNKLDVDGTFARSGIQFLHWNKRTNEWSEGIAVPPKASDGRAGGWVFFEVAAPTALSAKAMCDKYITSKGASFKGGMVSLRESTAVVGDTKISY